MNRDEIIEKLREFCCGKTCSECPLDTFAVCGGIVWLKEFSDNELQEAYNIAYPQDAEITERSKNAK